MLELPQVGETASCRIRLAQYCVGNGLDIGFGGSPIVPHAICIDRHEGHGSRANLGPDPWPTQLVGEADDLRWFKDFSLDWVYSSHVLEDFEDTKAVLSEWMRVLKIGGLLILFLPDQQTYLQHCEMNKSLPNQAHKHPAFSMEFVKSALSNTPFPFEIVHELWPVPNNAYSFDLVVRKLC